MPIIALIVSNKRWFAIIILCIIIVCQLVQANRLVNKLNKASDKCELEKQVIYDAHRKVQDVANKELTRISELYEIDKSKEKVVNNERIKEVQPIIRSNPVYSDCKLDDSVFSKVREATTTK